MKYLFIILTMYSNVQLQKCLPPQLSTAASVCGLSWQLHRLLIAFLFVARVDLERFFVCFCLLNAPHISGIKYAAKTYSRSTCKMWLYLHWLYKTLSFSSRKLIFVAPAKLPILIVGLSLHNRLCNVVIYCFGFLARGTLLARLTAT